MRLAAGLRPHPLGELKRSPDSLAAIRGPTSKGREGRGGEGEGEGKGGGTCYKVLGGIDAPGGLRTSTCQGSIVYAYERNCQGTCRPNFNNLQKL